MQWSAPRHAFTLSRKGANAAVAAEVTLRVPSPNSSNLL